MKKKYCRGPQYTFMNFLYIFFSGIRSWDADLMDCNLDQELKLFVSRHSARFSADVKGKTSLSYSSGFYIVSWLLLNCRGFWLSTRGWFVFQGRLLIFFKNDIYSHNIALFAASDLG